MQQIFSTNFADSRVEPPRQNVYACRLYQLLRLEAIDYISCFPTCLFLDFSNLIKHPVDYL
jgi:hypothetical protein